MTLSYLSLFFMRHCKVFVMLVCLNLLSRQKQRQQQWSEQILLMMLITCKKSRNFLLLLDFLLLLPSTSPARHIIVPNTYQQYFSAFNHEATQLPRCLSIRCYPQALSGEQYLLSVVLVLTILELSEYLPPCFHIGGWGLRLYQNYS